LSRVRVLAAKIESTPGTPESLAAADAAFNVFDPAIQQTADMAERPQQGGFGYLPDTVGARLGQVTFTTEAIAPSIAPDWAATFLPAVGLGSDGAGVYSLEPLPPEAGGSKQKTLTIGCYENGLFKSIYGAMGTAVFTFTAGKRTLVAFTFQGIWGAVSDEAILAPTYPTAPALRFVQSSFAIGSWTPKVETLTLDLANEVLVREDSTTTSGHSSACIVNRRPGGSLNPEAELVANNDLYGDWLAGTEQAIGWDCGSGDDAATFAATNCQYINPQETDRGGLAADDIAYKLNADDLSVTLVTTATTTFAP